MSRYKFSYNFARCLSSSMVSSDIAKFRTKLKISKNVVILTGAGISAESGIPTFRGAGGVWRKWQSTQLATPEAFRASPSRVWEFYHYRRELVRTKKPNAGHYAIAEFERYCDNTNSAAVSVVTQNVDGFHVMAGSKNVIELHGNLFKTRCTRCDRIEENYDSPICEALRGHERPGEFDDEETYIPMKDLPRCKHCDGLLRPHIVWFGEGLDPDTIAKASALLDICDMCLVVGTSSVVYPAATFAPQVAARGGTVAEFNLEETDVTSQFEFHFRGKSGELLPEALAPLT